MVKKVGKYELFRTLGEGTFGKVKYAVNTETNEAVAIKVLDKEKIQKQNMGAQIKKEISIMKMVRHTYVVGMKEVLASRTKIFIVLELVTGGELFDKIVNEGRFGEEKARFYFRQLVEGVEYCHGLGICHRDLKPENLLLDEKGDLKISDFGLSALYVGDPDADGTSRTELLHTTCGTPNYVAPKVLADQGYDGKKADVWSCGVILYVLLAGFLPFDESTIVALFSKIQNADFSYPSWFSPEVRSLLDRVLVADPKERASLTDVKMNSWMQIEDSGSAVEHAPLVRQPTQAQLEAAVEVAVETQLGGSDDATGGKGETEAMPQTISALDVLNRGDRTSSSIGLGDEGDRARRTFQFTSHQAPEELMSGVTAALTAMGFEVSPGGSADPFKAKGSLLTPKGMIGIGLQVYTLQGDESGALSLLELRRGKGDILEFHTSFTELVEKRINTLIITNKSK
eukprot:CAMPEP_0182437152 /NCGR_PEP_ID=MMETSP1167-20130531/84846_1 /TAXON_ID=2988 /ORGANISM="Mallomonas Sp, Strain CCMP3275" /LENGTH=455 /DNA_ID=CAMNT_0024629957 /DNA_START=152 /DNA_END=1519 /DNA_ORIENTATION=-